MLLIIDQVLWNEELLVNLKWTCFLFQLSYFIKNTAHTLPSSKTPENSSNLSLLFAFESFYLSPCDTKFYFIYFGYLSDCPSISNAVCGCCCNCWFYFMPFMQMKFKRIRPKQQRHRHQHQQHPTLPTFGHKNYFWMKFVCPEIRIDVWPESIVSLCCPVQMQMACRKKIKTGSRQKNCCDIELIKKEPSWAWAKREFDSRTDSGAKCKWGNSFGN